MILNRGESSIPYFSVIITTYNRANCILKTLNSVFSQTFKSFEIIVIDDCSTDNTIELLTPLSIERKIILIKNSQNMERNYSRNLGLEKAQGNYVTFLDSDDFMTVDNLEDAYIFIENNSEIKVFHNLYHYVNEDLEVIYVPKFPSLDNCKKAISNGNFMSLIGNFVHKDIYKIFRFDTDRMLIGFEDWLFWINVIAEHNVGRINKFNSLVSQHDERSVNNLDLKKLEAGANLTIQKITADNRLSEAYAPFLKNIASNCFLYLATVASQSNSFAKTFAYLYQAVKQNPKVMSEKRILGILNNLLKRN